MGRCGGRCRALDSLDPLVFYGNGLGQDTSEPEPGTDENQESHEYVICRRMTEKNVERDQNRQPNNVLKIKKKKMPNVNDAGVEMHLI